MCHLIRVFNLLTDLFVLVLWFNIPVNSYGHVEMVSNLTTIFFIGKLRLSGLPVLSAHSFV